MKKIGLIIALSTTLTSHGMNFVRNLFFVNPERTLTNLHKSLQLKNSDISLDEARNVINGTYGIEQFKNTSYKNQKEINLGTTNLSISQEELDTMVQEAKYNSPYIPHWATNAFWGIKGAATLGIPVLYGTAFTGLFAMGAPNANINTYFAIVGLSTITAAAIGGATHGYLSNSILKLIARNTKIKV